jgi:methionyl-tRNA formyltransferase
MIRLVILGSFYRGYCVLDEFLTRGPSAGIQVVGVATDDPTQTFISKEKRLWQYPHELAEEVMVEQLAHKNGLPVYKGRVKTEAFYDCYESVWRPDICLSATFGQRIDQRLFSFPRLGFFNLHPCIADGWPSRYAGPNPFQGLKDDGMSHTQVAFHHVDDGFDSGTLVAMSERIGFPPNASVIDLHKMTSPLVAKFAFDQTLKMVEQAALQADAEVQ